MLREEESVFSRDEPPDWLSNPKWYVGVTLNKFNKYVCLEIILILKRDHEHEEDMTWMEKGSIKILQVQYTHMKFSKTQIYFKWRL